MDVSNVRNVPYYVSLSWCIMYIYTFIDSVNAILAAVSLVSQDSLVWVRRCDFLF